jgi:hypothetical protein
MFQTEGFSINGTHLQGYLTATARELQYVFGPERTWPGDKSTMDWQLEFPDGTIATIYDYKYPPRSNGTPHRWHIGGFDNDAVARVTEYYDRWVRNRAGRILPRTTLTAPPRDVPWEAA